MPLDALVLAEIGRNSGASQSQRGREMTLQNINNDDDYDHPIPGTRYYCCTHLFIARRQSVAYVQQQPPTE